MKLTETLCACGLIGILAAMLLGPVRRAYVTAKATLYRVACLHDARIAEALGESEPRKTGR